MITKVYPSRNTPMRKIVSSFVLEHNSIQVEDGIGREVKCRVYCIMIGGVDPQLSQWAEKMVVVSGFLSQNMKLQLVLNVNKIDSLQNKVN